MSRFSKRRNLNGNAASVDPADVAGSIVREHIVSMTEDAEAKAADIERQAAEQAIAERERAQQSAEQVLTAIEAVERELNELLQGVSAEADGLREALAGSRGRSETVPDVRELVAETEPEPEPEPEPESEPEPEPEPEAEPEPAAIEELNGDAPESLDDEAESLPPLVASVGESSETLEEDARERVTGTTDVELAEMYSIAVDRLDAGAGEEEPYWTALVHATVAEAVARPEFGDPAASEGGRRAKKRRNKLLGPLIEAREDAMTEKALS